MTRGCLCFWLTSEILLSDSGCEPVKHFLLYPRPARNDNEFLLVTASGKVGGWKVSDKLLKITGNLAFTLGVMLSCLRLYAFLGDEFDGLLGRSKLMHPYQEWIDNYNSEGFQASALQMEEVLDKLFICLSFEEASGQIARMEYNEEYELCLLSLLVFVKAAEFSSECVQKSLVQLSGFEKWPNLRVIRSEMVVRIQKRVLGSILLLC
ncbi:OLC1v1029699C1 [Oldenlandia corymbosa var. corymbosa]|uniref:OLC1v1029699C1 n=1 Tax=Oldenlandia corymbosa var. corymbosa TaxID=529605 RepID=A0AAV1CHE0_OLDCO|nr:OLC1v1029699C1 [Oldenlandia corymbosa var. corymbosa]